MAPEQFTEVKRRFLSHESDEGFVFEIPNRIDPLQKVPRLLYSATPPSIAFKAINFV